MHCIGCWIMMVKHNGYVISLHFLSCLCSSPPLPPTTVLDLFVQKKCSINLFPVHALVTDLPKLYQLGAVVVLQSLN